MNIMKRNESLALSDLLSAASDALKNRFKASPKDLKKRIDDLVSRDYIEPDGDDVYLYVP